jgi:dihydropteroate synthase
MRPCSINGMQVGGDVPVRVMGVLNASPESFFPASYVPPGKAHARALAMLEQGADILDLGARATGPGSPPLTVSEERERVIATLRDLSGVGTLSLDTLHPEVLEAAMKYEIHAVNDISGLLDPRMRQLVADAGLPAILMAARKRPGDIGSVKEVQRALREVMERCAAAGVEEYILDPGIGLWTPARSVEDNWELCRHFSQFCRLGRPLLAAISRKTFLGDLLGEQVQDRMAGSLALNVLLSSRGASMVRTHDVGETADAIRVFEMMGRQ